MQASKKIKENANKIAYIVQQYPDKTLEEYMQIWQMPSIHINTGIWYAVEQGWIAEPDPVSKKIEFLKAPKKWNFGEVVDDLVEMIPYAFAGLAKNEADMDEHQFSQWTLGYAPYDVLCAMKYLLEKGVLATYDITDHKDTESTYTFYTLAENAEKMWGRKFFKEDPIAAQTDQVPDTIPADLTNKPEETPEEEGKNETTKGSS